MLQEKATVTQFEGYTIDLWTREFKKMSFDSSMVEIVPFKSEKGAALLRAMDAWLDDFWEAVNDAD